MEGHGEVGEAWGRVWDCTVIDIHYRLEFGVFGAAHAADTAAPEVASVAPAHAQVGMCERHTVEQGLGWH